MIDLTIVIASYETRGLLVDSLEAIARAMAAYPQLGVETIVVDNGSRDGSVEAARVSSASPRVVAIARNLGFASAVNRALRLRRGRHVLLLNSDAEIEENVLVDGVAILDESPDMGALGVALLHPDGRPQRSIHALPGLLTETLPEVILRRLRPSAYGSSPFAFEGSRVGREFDAVREVEAVRGAVLFIRGEVFEKIGSFDEGYFFFLEETDYCGRLRAAGYRVCQAENLRAVHRLGASSKARVPLETRIEFHRSLYRFIERWRGIPAARIVRGIRFLRSALGCALATPLSVVSAGQRARLAQRWGLVLWHLRGCPDDPRLGDALRTTTIASVPTAENGWRRSNEGHGG